MGRESVWMPVYIGDYLGDTQRLTTEQHGAYLLILMDYWRNGPPPADDAVLCQITGLKAARFRAHKSTLLGFFKMVDGRLHHGRADAEKAKAEQNHERCSQRARRAARVRWDGKREDAPSIAQALLEECASPSPSVTIVTDGAAADPVKSLFDSGIALLVGKGSAEGAARSLIGQLRKAVGDERLASLIAEAQRQDISEPRAWLTAAAKQPANDPLGGLLEAAAAHARRKADAA